jgi:hypothetical protein
MQYFDCKPMFQRYILHPKHWHTAQKTMVISRKDWGGPDCLKVLSHHLPGVIEENHEKSQHSLCSNWDINRHHSNTSQKCYLLSQIVLFDLGVFNFVLHMSVPPTVALFSENYLWNTHLLEVCFCHISCHHNVCVFGGGEGQSVPRVTVQSL